jgi:hypothetical protein
MRTKSVVALVSSGVLLLGGRSESDAQQPQIPTLQVCNKTKASGNGLVKIDSRADAQHNGTFRIELDLRCDGSGYPTGKISVERLSMSDSIIEGTWESTSIEQLTSTGRATPNLYVNGRCKAERAPGCRFWLMLADNRRDGGGTPDVVGFLVVDAKGQRMAHAVGPVVDGHIEVAPTAN